MGTRLRAHQALPLHSPRDPTQAELAEDRKAVGTDIDTAITPLRRAAENLSELLFRAAEVVLFECDTQAQQLRWPAALRPMLGLENAGDDEVDAALRQLIAPLLVAADCDEGTIELENTLRLPRRAPRRYRMLARWAGDDAHVLTGALIDVTNRQVAEPATEVRDRYRLLVELSPDAICVHCDGLIVFANQAGMRLIGAAVPDDVLGCPILDFVEPASRGELLTRIAAMKETDTHSEPAEAGLMRLDGTVVPVESISVRTRWEDRPAYQVIMRDLTHQKAAEASLRLSANLIEHVSDAIIGTDTAGRITRWNPAATELYGYPAAAVVGRDLGDLLDSDPESPVTMRLPRGVRAEVTHRRHDGTALHALVSVADVKDESGAVTGSVMIASDISDRRRAERIRQQADARYSAAVAALDEGVVILGVDDTVEQANPAALALLGRPDLVGCRFLETVALLDEQGDPLPFDALGLVASRESGEERPAFTAAVKRRGEQLTFLTVSIRTLPSEAGVAPYPVVMCLQDVTERHAAAALLRYEARHDHMTGLANRTLALETVSELLRQPHASVGVLFIDLDRFKMVNDSLGHDAGDSVLRTIARRLADAEPEATVGRLAGDEFVVVVPDADERDMQERAAALLARLREPVRIAGRDVVVTCSIGIVVTDPGAGRPESGHGAMQATDVLRDADVAMYYAKQHGRNRMATFDERFRRRAVDRLELQEDLRQGLERGEMYAAYQPIVSLAELRTTSVEALARWTHPERGNVSPTAFIPIAEETGLIVPLGRQMVDQAMRQVAHWRRTGQPDLVMSVNLSPRQLADPRVAERVAELLAEHELPAQALNLEITEGALMDDPELAARILTQLRDLGVGISVDDFGTGYSSLSYLRRFPVTSVKIDRSFVENLGLTRHDDAIVTGIINLAHELGLAVVAEGVEHEGQLRALQEFGCDYAQGYLFSEPLSPNALTSLLGGREPAGAR